MPADSSLISVTAKIAAYYRQFSDIPFAKEVAKRIGADAAFDQILRENGLERDKLTFYAPMFEGRYKVSVRSTAPGLGDRFGLTVAADLEVTQARWQRLAPDPRRSQRAPASTWRA